MFLTSELPQQQLLQKSIDYLCKAKYFATIAITIVLLNGCATGLNYNQKSPNAEKFKPQSTVILPMKFPEGYDLEQEKIGNILTDALTSSNIYGRVADPAYFGHRDRLFRSIVTAI